MAARNPLVNVAGEVSQIPPGDTLVGVLYSPATPPPVGHILFGANTGGDEAPAWRAMITGDLPNGVGTVTSVAVANATGITWTGSPITTSGTLTPALSANLQAWSAVTTASKANLAGAAFTGAVTNSATGEAITATAGFYLNSGAAGGYFFHDRTSSRFWGWYGTGDVARLYNGSSDVIQVTGAGGVAIPTTLSVGGGATAPVFGAQQTVHSTANTQVYLGLYQPGFGAGGIGFLASNTTMRIVNSYNTGQLADGLGIDITTGGIVQLKAAGQEFQRAAANSTTLTRQPRHFVQATDPGAAAADGDVWTNTA